MNTPHRRRPQRESYSEGRAPSSRTNHDREAPREGSRDASRAAASAPARLHPQATPPATLTFDAFALSPKVLDAIDEMGIHTPTPIQRLAIQPILDGKDVIAKAETGTGKTLAFGAPMISKIDPDRRSVLGLVLCPTRELAEQVWSVLSHIGRARTIKVALIVGGAPIEPQIKALQEGSQVVVGTPGRVLDLLTRRILSFPWTEFAVLDEADEMLEIGFLEDINKILSKIPDEAQTLLFSATFPPDLLRLARDHTRDPVELATSSGVSTVKSIDQRWMRVHDDDRALTIMRLIEQSRPEDVFLIFGDRRTEVDRLFHRLERLPYRIKCLHGGYEQDARFRVMSAFRSGEVKALVATDVASRGLDVKHVTHVVNYGPPQDITDYTHRIGRTGRAGRSGHAITLVPPMGMGRWRRILAAASWPIPEEPPPRAGDRRDGSRRPPSAAPRAARSGADAGRDRPHDRRDDEVPPRDDRRRGEAPLPSRQQAPRDDRREDRHDDRHRAPSHSQAPGRPAREASRDSDRRHADADDAPPRSREREVRRDEGRRPPASPSKPAASAPRESRRDERSRATPPPRPARGDDRDAPRERSRRETPADDASPPRRKAAGEERNDRRPHRRDAW